MSTVKGKGWANQFVMPGGRQDNRIGGIGPSGFDKHSANGIRSSKNAAIAVPPRGVPTPQNFTDKYSLQQRLLTWDTAVSGNVPTALHALVYTPSNRLILTLQIAIEPDNLIATDPTFNVQPTWSVRRMIINSTSGRETPASQFYPSTGVANIPDETIIPDAPELVRVEITNIDDQQFNTAPYTTSNVALVLQAKWEPDVQTIPPAELQRLYSRCRSAYGQPVVILNNPIP